MLMTMTRETGGMTNGWRSENNRCAAHFTGSAVISGWLRACLLAPSSLAIRIAASHYLPHQLYVTFGYAITVPLFSFIGSLSYRRCASL